jgi:hypothetical protein
VVVFFSAARVAPEKRCIPAGLPRLIHKRVATREVVVAPKPAGLRSPQNREITESALLRHEITRKAFNKLIDRGVNKAELLSLLLAIPVVPNKPIRLVDGMEDRTVRKFPDRVRKWADTIEKVNGSPWLEPDFLPRHVVRRHKPEIYPQPLKAILTPEWAEPTAQLFKSIPRTLRFYADHLQARLEFFHPTGKRKREFGYPNAIRLPKYLTLKLLRLVRDSAHRPCYNTISVLLVAAYDMAGKPRPNFISEHNLPKLEKNNPWITWLLHEESLQAKGEPGHSPIAPHNVHQ